MSIPAKTALIIFLRLYQIVGDQKRGIPGILPIGRTTFLNGVKAGKYTRPIRLTARTVAWISSEIDAINAALIAGKSDEEIKKLVADLEAARTENWAGTETLDLGGEAVER
jgi:prophage regulatory protein